MGRMAGFAVLYAAHITLWSLAVGVDYTAGLALAGLITYAAISKKLGH